MAQCTTCASHEILPYILWQVNWSPIPCHGCCSLHRAQTCMLFAPTRHGCCSVYCTLDYVWSTVSWVLFPPVPPVCCLLHCALYVVHSIAPWILFALLRPECCLLHHALDVVCSTVPWMVNAPRGHTCCLLCWGLDVVRSTTPLNVVRSTVLHGCCLLHVHRAMDVVCYNGVFMFFAPLCPGCWLLHRVQDVVCSTKPWMLFAPLCYVCCLLCWGLNVFFFFYCAMDVICATVS